MNLRNQVQDPAASKKQENMIRVLIASLSMKTVLLWLALYQQAVWAVFPHNRDDGQSLTDFGEDATPAERTAEKTHKKRTWLQGEQALQQNIFDKWEHDGLANAAKNKQQSKNLSREKEWKAHEKGAPLSEQGAYASGTYAKDDKDWEAKLGGVDPRERAIEKEQKDKLAADEKVSAVIKLADMSIFSMRFLTVNRTCVCRQTKSKLQL